MRSTRRAWLSQACSGFAGGMLVTAGSDSVHAAAVLTADICVYGGTASGVMAAIASAREGLRVVVVEPSRWLGGMTGGGLSHIDWGRQEAVGGTTRGILKQGHNDPEYRRAFAALLEKYGVAVVFEHRVQAVDCPEATIRSIILEEAPPDRLGCPVAEPTLSEALQVNAQVFVDCSYEGDLMARAGVSYTFGREARETYGESLAGVQEPLAVYDIDPYLEPGRPESGLLPVLQEMPDRPIGAADSLTMGYGFRWKYSKQPDQLPLDAPDDYDPRLLEVYRRGFRDGINMFIGRRMRKLGVFEDASGNPFQIGMGNLSRALWAATAFGSNAAYPDGDYATRAHIWKEQQNFVRGLTHFMRIDRSVNEKWKTAAQSIGLEPGIFDDTAGYPHQLYVREARRMQASTVVTQADMEGRTDPDDSVGLASYGVDEWPYATYPLDGKVALAGGYYSMLTLDEVHRGIYKISYRAIVPRQQQCTNLLVPVCLSASHIAMTSIRMEPVWMILGESAGVAAAMAVAGRLPVQQIDITSLQGKLRDLGQKLAR